MGAARFYAALLALLTLAFAASLWLGETPLTLSAVLHPGSVEAQILQEVRLPRSLAAALTGASLGLAGALMQGLLRNPLADPGVLGVSAGAGFGAVLCIIGGGAGLTLEAGALAGALGVASLTLLFAARVRAPEALILFGVGLSSLFGALTTLCFNLTPTPMALSEAMNWLMGSVEARSFTDAGILAAGLVVAAALSWRVGPYLRILTLGDDAARLSALPAGQLKLIGLGAAALVTGLSVAVTGVVGFVGLAAPHAVRRFVRDDPAAVLAPASLAGAIACLLADLAARLIPTETPLRLGVVTALIGAPLFLWIAARASRSFAR